jgi:hypothetical protein
MTVTVTDTEFKKLAPTPPGQFTKLSSFKQPNPEFQEVSCMTPV